MPKFILLVNHDGGVFEEPMDTWQPGDIAAHFDYYALLTKELTESGEMVQFMALADPRQARTVRADGVAAPVVTDGPFAESKEVLMRLQRLRRRVRGAGPGDRRPHLGRARARRCPHPAAGRGAAGHGRRARRTVNSGGGTSGRAPGAPHGGEAAR